MQLSPTQIKNFFLLFLMLFIPLFILNILFPSQSDDLGAFGGGDKGFFNSYFTWNGRFGENLYTGFLAQFNQSIIFDVINAIVGALFFIITFILYFGRLPQNRLDSYSFMLLCLLCMLFSVFGATFLWGAGSLNYLWGISFIVLFLLPFRFFWADFIREKSLGYCSFNFAQCFYAIALLPLAVIAGMSSEVAGLILSGILFLSLVFAVYKKVKLPLWYIFGTLGFWCGYIILYLSPGSRARAQGLEGFLSVGDFLNLSFFEQIIRINSAFRHFYSDAFVAFLLIFCITYLVLKGKFNKYSFLYLPVFVLVLVVIKNVSALPFYILILCLIYSLRERDERFLVIFWLFFVWVMSACILTFTENLAHRARFADNLLLFLSIILIFRIFYQKSLKPYIYERTLGALFSVCLLVVFANFSLMAYNWNLLKQDIARQKSQGIEDVVVSEKYFVCLKKFKGWDNPQENPEYWVNPAYAKHFGVKSFSVRPEK
ncbi:DUF6056 family protein [Helicobacter himalayensis]|uniref:DUF6056 family protein n=1 Tax=Helicobacter himalayensis TaxID=1591088 RepID=UPI003D700F19